MRHILALFYMAIFATIGCRNPHNCITEHDRQEFEMLDRMLYSVAVRQKLPYDKKILAGGHAISKFRQVEYLRAQDGEMCPLGFSSRGDAVSATPRGSIILRLSVSLSGSEKTLFYSPPNGKRKKIFVVNHDDYAVLRVKLFNVESESERIVVSQNSPLLSLCDEVLGKWELVLVFTPAGLYTRPWYCYRFQYYCM